MNKRILIGLLFSLLSVILLPSTVLAAAPASMSASGVITGISVSEEFVAGNSGNVRVVNRDIYGSFTAGDIQGDFVMSYKAVIELATQSGNFNGTLTSGSYVFKVSGQVQPVQLIPVPDLPDAYIGVSVSTGQWTLKTDDNSQGVFTAIMYFVPTPDGHIAYVLPGSTFNMSGVWTR